MSQACSMGLIGVKACRRMAANESNGYKEMSSENKGHEKALRR